ncbi:MAG: aminotransferase class I/II-fold pyridoxal phosphate-dependent enzyme, partial [Actinobacteria bacterium]|nr:aminotransferase class I/II-fold pyridoxal phosphate-dependent enzyme [Actinomycetota bacterium]
MTILAAETGSFNLGQGFPDMATPPEVLDAAQRAMLDGINQYTHPLGEPELRSAIAEHQARFWDMEVDAASEVLVTCGATEAIAATMLALIEPGDEVVMFEPYFDSYSATVSMAGGVRKVVTLYEPAASGSGWRFELDEVRAAIGPRTRALLLNTPHNPTG